MQLVCQRNSLNRRGVTAREIAELSEILTVQENKGGVLVANRWCKSNGLEGRNGRGRVFLNAHAAPLTHSTNRSSQEKCFRLTHCFRVHLPNRAKTLSVSSSPFFGSLRMEVCLLPVSASTLGQCGN